MMFMCKKCGASMKWVPYFNSPGGYWICGTCGWSK